MNRSTCYLMYNTTRTGLAAEMYHFDMDLKTEERMNSKTTEELHGIHEKPPKTNFEDMQTHIMNKYLLRPETIESLYIMYVKTGNPVFRYSCIFMNLINREWGWKIWSSIKRYCKREYGFADMHNVNEVRSGNDDRGETFFYSETMKYLYLLFSEDGVNYMDNYVFNTEAHPIPLKKE